MAQDKSGITTAYRGPVRRIRAVVAAGRWRVDKETRVARMSLPPGWTPADERASQRASYYEVIDDRGDVYRRRIVDPTDTSVELFEHGEISRVDTKRDVRVDILAPEARPIERIRLVVQGRDLPLSEGRKKPHTNGYRVQGTGGRAKGG